MKEKRVTLNKAAKIMKRIKDRNTELSEYGNFSMFYPVDAISGKSPEMTKEKIKLQVSIRTKAHQEVIDTARLYSEIKSAIIQENVSTGLFSILCEIDMLKNIKKYLENYIQIQSSPLSSRGVNYVPCSESTLNSEFGFPGLLNQIVEDITRQDSKTSSVNLVIELEIFKLEVIEQKLKEISKRLDFLEDEKYRINNSYSITLQIPDSLVEFLGVE